MAIRNIITNDLERLTKKSREVEKFDDRLAQLLDDLTDTLRHSGGVGLAAPQVGILRRAVVIDIGQGLIELVNPKIAMFSGEQDGSEGCLSFPNEYGLVKRPMHVKVKAHDRNGKPFEVSGDELLARALCHEIDHLDGIVFKSRVSRMLRPEEIEL
ncbi:MAG: peptide deformylase [Oscillospiraceae bacterium]|jgi:peptide deformylase|nr:peptide deformylase [Oscillospiraceae bacterium]